MEGTNKIKPFYKIAIVGPESCGKTTLAKELTQLLNGCLVEEFAREYLSNYGPEYDLMTLLHINKIQLEKESEAEKSGKQWIICDTTPMVNEIWAQEVFGVVPEVISQSRPYTAYDFYLLCAPDLPWVADPLRENPFDRQRLFDIYHEKIKNANLPFGIVREQGEKRLEIAYAQLKTYFDL